MPEMKRKHNSRIRSSSIIHNTVCAAFAVTAVACVAMAANPPVLLAQAGPPSTSPAITNDRDVIYEQVSLLAEIAMHIKRYYVTEKSYKEIMAGALHGMLQNLDPHSDFLEEEAYKNVQEDTSGKFSGIGVHIGMREGVLTVIAPIEDTPAFRAGLQSGDRILAIDGEKTARAARNQGDRHNCASE